MENVIQASNPVCEVFYKYNLMTGSYDYITPAQEEATWMFLHKWVQEGDETRLAWIHPDDRMNVRAHFSQVAHLHPHQVHNGSRVYCLRIKDNGRYRWFRDRYVVIFDLNDQPQALIGSITDITFEKKAEDSLQTYAHIVSASSEYLALIDRLYTYRAINLAYAQTLEKSSAEIIGRSVADLMGVEVFESTLKPMADRCLSGEKVAFQLWHGFPNGRRRLLDIVYAPHFEKGSQPKTISAYVERTRDITGIAKLEEQLRQSCKLETIGMLTGSIAHDFNNILSAILGYSEISLKMATTGSELHGYLKRILDASNRASHLVRQILNFSRKGEQEFRPIQIRHIVEEVLSLIRASLPVTIIIKRDLRSDAFIMCDSTQIYQILMNLCSNAGYAMRESGGILTVSLEDIVPDASFIQQNGLKAGPYIKLSVTDTGVGMTAEVQQWILEPFFTTKEKGKGTGIGLSLTHDLIRKYGGQLTVKSVPGEGATFNVFIPVLDGKHFLVGETTEGLPTGHERILFVDDEDFLADLGKQMIESLGYTVTSRVSSLEALRLFQHQPEAFDLVITDLVMPDMTGDALIRQIKTIRPDIPIILTTGFTEQISPEKAAELGACQLAFKPVVMKDMARFIREALSA